MKQISNFKKSIPDGERFLQEPLSQCSCRRANAYIGGQNPLTWEGIYQEMRTYFLYKCCRLFRFLHQNFLKAFLSQGMD
jgi:hypothetical protein